MRFRLPPVLSCVTAVLPLTLILGCSGAPPNVVGDAVSEGGGAEGGAGEGLDTTVDDSDDDAIPHDDTIPSDGSLEPRRILTVTSTADSGPGTLRQNLLNARSGDTIVFDTTVFPPAGAVTISLTTGLPAISQGDVSIKASNAGVALDGAPHNARLGQRPGHYFR